MLEQRLWQVQDATHSVTHWKNSQDKALIVVSASDKLGETPLFESMLFYKGAVGNKTRQTLSIESACLSFRH